jgi:diguanylate cyclase (GGDEF)-like protein/PAS domain S-box-containing protein
VPIPTAGELEVVGVRLPGGAAVKKSFNCAALMEGCCFVCVGVDDDDILRQVLTHAAADHGMQSPPPEVTAAVLTAIAPVPDYLADALSSAGLMHQVFQDAPTAVAVTSADGTLDQANRALCELLRIPAAELVGTQLEVLIHPDDLAAVLSVRANLLAGLIRRSQLVVRLVRGDGSIISVELTCAPVLDGPTPSGQIISHLQDVTDRRAEQERLTVAARTDSLTGLWNRATLFEELEFALAHRDRRRGTVAVLFCDIDDFKSINDRYGHHVGDAVIVEFAARLTAVKRPTDVAARLAGDEFVLVYEDGPNLDTAALVERLHAALSRPFAVDGVQVGLTTSIGTAVAGQEDVTAITLLQRADRAMYSVKASRHAGFR